MVLLARLTMVRAAFFRSYLAMMHVEPGWDEFLKRHQVGYVLLPRRAALATVLSGLPGWKPLYSDDEAIVFKETGRNLEDADGSSSR